MTFHGNLAGQALGCLLTAILFLAGCGVTQSRYGDGELAGEGGNSSQSYRLGPHDVLRIGVFDEPDLTTEIEVDGEGRITVPLIGELAISGKTLDQVEDRLTARLKAGYLKNPKVNLSIVRYRNFYVHGEARNPGAYPYQTGMTVLKAITQAGGFTERAAKGRTKVHRMINGKEEKISVNMEDFIQPDDIVLVPESFF